MWRQLAVVVTLISACAPVADDEAAARQRQPLPLAADLSPVKIILGPGIGAQLGHSIDACRGGGALGGYLAGAPGIDGVYASPLADFYRVPNLDPNEVVGLSVWCDRSQGLGLASGGEGLYRFFSDGGTEMLFDDGEVTTIAGGVSNAPPLFSARDTDGGSSIYRMQFAGGVVSTTLLESSDSPTWGSSISYGPLADRALVGDSARARALLYKQLADGGIELNLVIDGGDVMGEFGKTVLMADVTPDLGAELIIASPSSSRVSVYSGTRLRYELEGFPFTTSGGQVYGPVEFGAALAIEPRRPGVDLGVLWVGEPGRNRVYRCVGSTCAVFGVPLIAGRFGSVIAFDGDTLLVGAPEHSGTMLNQGAVYEYTFDAGTWDGEAQSCTVGQSCRLDGRCETAACVGGVFCLSTGVSSCAVGEVCANGVCGVPVVDGGLERDAGVDAGVNDGGVEVDAGVDGGVADAGVNDGGVDAGSPDGGTLPGEDDSLVTYRAGCSSAPGMLWVILAALGWRRRR